MADKLDFIDVQSAEGGESSVKLVTKTMKEGGHGGGIVDESAKSSESFLTSTLREAKHPTASIFHLLFKLSALLVYIFAGLVSSSFVFIFVICILLLAFDFWTVKNVTGRLLVGLRWWNRIRDDGSSDWIFESIEDPEEVGHTDSRIFWIGLYGTPVIWMFLLFVSLLKFNLEWIIIVLVALTLSAANIIGYTKCRKDAKQKMQSVLQSGAFGAIQGGGGSSLFSKIVELTSWGSSAPNSTEVV